MLAHTFRGSTWRTWLGLESEREAFRRYKAIRRREREFFPESAGPGTTFIGRSGLEPAAPTAAGSALPNVMPVSRRCAPDDRTGPRPRRRVRRWWHARSSGWSIPAAARELKPATLAAFEKYVTLTEARMARES